MHGRAEELHGALATRVENGAIGVLVGFVEGVDSAGEVGSVWNQRGEVVSVHVSAGDPEEEMGVCTAEEGGDSGNGGKGELHVWYICVLCAVSCKLGGAVVGISDGKIERSCV